MNEMSSSCLRALTLTTLAECGIGAKLPTVLAEAFTSVLFRIAVAVRLNVKSCVTSKDVSVWRQTCDVGPSILG